MSCRSLLLFSICLQMLEQSTLKKMMASIGTIRSRIGLMVLIFDLFLIHFFFHFCRHRPSKMKWKMNWKMRTVNLPPWNFEKWVKNGTVHFLAPWQPWTLHLAAGPALSYHFPNAFCQPQIFLESLLIGLQSIKSF